MVPDAGGLPLLPPGGAGLDRRPRLRGLARPAAQRRPGYPGQAAGSPRGRAAGLRPRYGGARRKGRPGGAALRPGTPPAGAGGGPQGRQGAPGRGKYSPGGRRPRPDREPRSARGLQDRPGPGRDAGPQGLLARPRGPRARSPHPGPAPGRGGQQGPAARKPHARRHPARPLDRSRAGALRPLRERGLPRRSARLLRVRGARLERLLLAGPRAPGRPAAREPDAQPAAEPQRDPAAPGRRRGGRGPGAATRSARGR